MQNHFGGKRVIYSNEDSTGAECSILWGDSGSPVVPYVLVWQNRHMPRCHVANSSGTCHGLVPRARAPRLRRASHPSSAAALQRAEVFTRPSSREPAVLHTPLQEVRGLVHASSAKKGSLALNMHCYGQESRITLFWESSKPHDISRRLHCLS